MKQLYALIESKTYLHFPELYRTLNIQETRYSSARQLNKAIAKSPPDFMLAEFIYGFGSNYAGVNISNLDVSLYTLQRHAPMARVIVFADKIDFPHLPKLERLFTIDAALRLPVLASDLESAIKNMGG